MIKKTSNSLKKVIVDYKKLTPDILSMLVDKYPDGYGDDDIISFRNAKNEVIEAVELRTDECLFLVKVSTKLVAQMERFDADDTTSQAISNADESAINISNEEEE